VVWALVPVGCGWQTTHSAQRNPARSCTFAALALPPCHAVSDGLAVGAASLSELPQISLGVATAMVVHKGPVAIGLATFLRSAQWTPAQVHRGGRC
jgi:zinc transporter 9